MGGEFYSDLWSWWRHQMETFSALLAICAENSPVPGEFPAQRPVTRSFDVFFDLHPNKRLSKQSWGWWSETPSSSLWRHRNGWSCLWVPYMRVTLCQSMNCGAIRHEIITWSIACIYIYALTHLPLEKMAAISLRIFTYAFSWMKSYVSWLKFHRSLFLKVQLTINRHWFR